MKLPNTLKHLFSFFELNKAVYINELKDIVAIPSMSTLISHRQDVCEMIHWTATRLRKIGVDVSINDLGTQMLPDGKTIPYPPCILGYYKTNKKYKTVCMYGHVDVYTTFDDNWLTKPFELVERDGKLYGRGSADNKGPLLCWIHAIEGYQSLGYEVPVNIKFIIEPMRHVFNYGLSDVLKREEEFLNNVDYICINDIFWLGSQTPCISYSTRGFCHFLVEIDSLPKDLAVELYSGIVYEGMSDMIYLLDTLVDNRGNIMINDINKNVAPLTPEEEEMYSRVDLDLYEFNNIAGEAKSPWGNDKLSILSHIWRYPSLSIHSVQNRKQSTTRSDIPSKIKAQFSIRIVPNQTTEEIKNLVFNHITEKWKERASSNNMKIEMIKHCNPCTEDPNHPNYMAAQRAIKSVYNKQPLLIRDGTSSAAAIILKELLNKNILFLPLCSMEARSYEPNEKIYTKHYINGTKVIAAYLREISLLP